MTERIRTVKHLGATGQRLPRTAAAVAVLLLAAHRTSPPAFAADGDASAGRFLALCVGLKYPGTKDSLRFTTDDVRKIADAFRATSGYAADGNLVEALVDDEVGAAKPTVREIRRRLGAMAAQAGPDDRLVFYFSGHGLLGGDSRSILVCADASRLEDESAHLYLSEVKTILSASAARDRLVIVDACHSGGKAADSGGLTPDSVAAAMGGGGKGADGAPVAGDVPELPKSIDAGVD